MYAEDGGTLNFVFDAMIRRSILDSISVIRWATSSSVFPCITSDVWLWAHITQAFELSIDAIRNLVSVRAKLEEVKANRKPKEEKSFIEHIPGVPSDSDEEEDTTPDPQAIDAANRAILNAVQSANGVCTHLITSIISAVQTKRQAMAAVDELDPFIVTVMSLLRNILRSAVTAHTTLLDDAAAFLAGEGALQVFDPLSITSALPVASFTPTVSATWNSFVESF